MEWSQEDVTEVYRTVKRVASKINPNGKTRAQLIHQIRQGAKYKLRFKRVHRNSTRFLVYSDNASNRKFKSFVKGKYGSIGLPSREQDMLSKMIDSIVDNIETNETTLDSLGSAVSKAEVAVARAKTIANDCENIMSELDKISNRLDGNE